MSREATSRFDVKSWDEQPAFEIAGAPKLTRAQVKTSFAGDVEGSGTVEYLMMYRDDGTASFLGFELVQGSLAGRSGSFVVEHRGTYEGGIAKAESRVVPGSGSGDLRGLTGEGGFEAPSGGGIFTLRYELEPDA